MSEERHYSAFISYRHVENDIRIAKHIQQKLERFKAPKPIREKYGIDHFDKVFRDQEELEIGSDLSAKINYALEHSDFLIVICSPEYNQSKWCLMEVENFLKHHDFDHVLCVLSSGEPPAIFPEILYRHAEPLACDYRMDLKEADRIELPRLISPMIGCTYDELVMRQERYRRKRLTAILTAAFVSAFIIISYLLYSNAIISRNFRQSQINESRLLARESLNRMEEADRYKALSSALTALGEDRPQTDDAIYALSKAANAYLTPFQYKETWRIDKIGDITDFIISKDGSHIIYQTRDGFFHTVDCKTKEELVSFDAGSDVLSFQEGESGKLILYSQGSLRCIDYRSGEEDYEVPMKYQSIGISRMSPSGNYIATADSFAMQITDGQGNPFLSMPLPEKQDGYIIDFCWAKDERYLAVKLRLDNRSYGVGLFEFETSAFHIVTKDLAEIQDFGFLDDGRLYVISADGSDQSLESAGSIITYERNFFLDVYDREELLFHKQMRGDVPSDQVFLIDDKEQFSLFLGKHIDRFDKTGEEIGQYDIPSGAVDVLLHDQSFIYLLTKDGYIGTLFYEDGRTSFNKSFPKDVTAVKMVRSADPGKDVYAVLKDGDLRIYESAYDENLTILSDKGFYYPPQDSLISENRIAVLSDGKLLLYPLNESGEYAEIALEKGHAYHLLKLDEKELCVLMIDAKTSLLSLLIYSTTDGQLISKIDLPISDYYLKNKILTYPLEDAEAIFLDALYQDVALNEVKLYLHDETDSKKIVIADLETKEISSISLRYDGDLLVNGRAAKLFVSKDGSRLLSFDENKALLFDLTSGELISALDETGGKQIADIGEMVALRGVDHLDLYSKDGELRHQIEHPNFDILSLKIREDQLFSICDDRMLRIYRNDQLQRSIALSFPAHAYDMESGFSYEFVDDRLYLYNDGCLEVISLQSDSSLPLYYVEGSVLNYDQGDGSIIMYSYDPQKSDAFYYPASIREYDALSLYDKAKKQLEDFLK